MSVLLNARRQHSRPIVAVHRQEALQDCRTFRATNPDGFRRDPRVVPTVDSLGVGFLAARDAYLPQLRQFFQFSGRVLFDANPLRGGFAIGAAAVHHQVAAAAGGHVGIEFGHGRLMQQLPVGALGSNTSHPHQGRRHRVGNGDAAGDCAGLGHRAQPFQSMVADIGLPALRAPPAASEHVGRGRQKSLQSAQHTVEDVQFRFVRGVAAVTEFRAGGVQFQRHVLHVDDAVVPAIGL